LTPSKNETVPVSPDTEELIAAVRTTFWPTVEGLGDDVRVVVVVAWHVAMKRRFLAEEVSANRPTGSELEAAEPALAEKAAGGVGA